MNEAIAAGKSGLRARPPKYQILRFAAVGVVGTAIHYAVLIAAVELAGASPVTGTFFGFITAAFVSYFLNAAFTFGQRPNLKSGLFKNYISLAFGLAINVGTVAALTHWEVPYIPSQIAATVLAFIWNFLASKFIVFR